MERSARMAAALVAAAALTISTACSSSKSSSGSPAATPTSSAATSPTPSSAASTPSTATLTAIAVQPSDLPAGWTSKPAEPEPDQATNQAALVSCVGGRNTSPDETAHADSPDYSQGEATISSSVKAFSSQSDVTADAQLLASPKINDCFSALIKAQLAKSAAGTTINSVTVAVTPGSGGGPSNVVGTATGQISLTAQGQTAVAFLDVAFISGPSREAEVDFENLGTPVPATLRSAVVAKVAARTAQG
jgi:hypothetical protein